MNAIGNTEAFVHLIEVAKEAESVFASMDEEMEMASECEARKVWHKLQQAICDAEIVVSLRCHS
jgi:hypothetical protein